MNEKQTAILFLEWSWKNGYERYTNSKNKSFWISAGYSEDILTTEELFDEFLKSIK